VDGIATVLRARRSAIPIPVRERGFYLLQNVQIDFRAHPGFYLVTTDVISRSKAAWTKFSAHVHLVPRLRATGTTLLLPVYFFMMWTRKTLLFCSEGTVND
jgi:hypothetical protein